MNNPCPNCGFAGNNPNCRQHVTYWGINPLPDSVPAPPQPTVTWIPSTTSAELFAEIGRLNVLLNERDKEIERLQHDVADLQMLRDEHQMDVMHAFQEGGEDDRRKVVVWLRANTCGCHDFAGDIERGEHRKESTDQFGRILPLEGHHKDCGHGKDGWSLCTCDELKKPDEERASKQFKDLVEEGQNLRKEFDGKTAGMRGPPHCSKCGDTGLVQVAPNARGVKQCDCKKYGPHHPECGRAKPGMRSPCNCLGLYERDARNQRDLDRCFDELVKDDKVTCDHGNTECKRCGVGQPTRDPLKELDELKECLRWYVENDDTNEGGKWEESNASWLEGKRRAMRALGMEEE